MLSITTVLLRPSVNFGWTAILPRPSAGGIRRGRLPLLSRLYSSSSTTSTSSTSSSSLYALDPLGNVTETLFSHLNIPKHPQQQQLLELSSLVVDWNEKINLISRKDCNMNVVFGRHVVPSMALSSLLQQYNTNNTTDTAVRIADVGTGGGFPGLPLAILFPNYEFTLMDSVAKKIKVVDDMTEQLQLQNVKTYNGRVEEYNHNSTQKFDFVVGRSVTALNKFCFWIEDLLKEDGTLVYIIGGEKRDLPSMKDHQCTSIVPLNDLLLSSNDSSSSHNLSDKYALVFTKSQVRRMAKESGETKKKTPSFKQQRTTTTKQQKNTLKTKKKDAKGAWAKKDSSVKKERGYDNFKRYSA